CQPEVGEDVAALVNGRPIFMDDLELAAKSWSMVSLTDVQKQKLNLQSLEQLIEQELIVQEAQRRGLTVSEADLNRRIKEIRADYPDDSFEKILIHEYIDFGQWKEKLRDNLLIQKVTEAEMKVRIKLDGQEWAAFFKAHSQSEPSPQRVQVRHITTAKREQAETLLKMVKAGHGFTDLSAAEKKLNLTISEAIWVYPQMLPASMARAVLETKAGQVSEIVESRYGFTIFEVLTVEASPPPDAVTAMARIRRAFQEHQKAEAYAMWVTELRDRAQVVINPALSKIQPGPAEPEVKR
ncbi:MAG: SurA N-terminal domain-containing protein, partial [Pseudomonadota bacterium]